MCSLALEVRPPLRIHIMNRLELTDNGYARAKENDLRGILTGMSSCLIAFSGGVDSSYLALIAHQELGSQALAVTAESPSYPAHHKSQALQLVNRYGIRHQFIRSNELENPNYVDNPINRCYFCKHELYEKLQKLAVEKGFECVADGNNVDDKGDYRPGRRAGIEMAIRSPLIEANLSKHEIRSLSRMWKLSTWDQPASACLSSRIPYGFAVTEEKLRMIEQGEEVLRSLGFRQSRVRHHGDIVRIEIAREELGKAMSTEMFDQIATAFKALGFRFVTLDLEGYRSGALNEIFIPEKTQKDQ